MSGLGPFLAAVNASMMPDQQTDAPPDALAANMVSPVVTAAPNMSVPTPTPAPVPASFAPPPPDDTMQRLAAIHAALNDQRARAAAINAPPEQQGQAEIDRILAKGNAPPQPTAVSGNALPAAGSSGPTIGPPPPPPRAPVTFAGGGGVIPAHEQERRGPSLLRAQGEANAAVEGAIGGNLARSERAAADEAMMFYDQQRVAQARQDAAEAAAAARAAELQQRQQDFDSSVKQLSQMSVDPNRFWASRSTGQKIAGLISITLGGFLQGAHGGPNQALDVINQAIDRDIDAQKFAYGAARDAAQAKQTAFGMAVQKYGSEDAATAAAKAAALDVAQAQISQFIAQNKGTEAANRAAIALAQLQQDKMNQIAQGIAFIPATQAPRMYMSPEGIPMTEAEAKAYYNRQREMGFELGKQELGQEGALQQEFVKASIAQGGKTDEGARHISQQLQTAGVPQAKAAAQHALAALNVSPGGSGEAAARWALGDGVIANKVMGNDANAREQAYWNFANQAMKAMMGNVTESEFARAQKQLGSASDPESRRRAIANTLQQLNAIEANAKAGESPAAQARFDEQRKAAGTPAYKSSLQIYGGK